jgi:hypothetical protein
LDLEPKRYKNAGNSARELPESTPCVDFGNSLAIAQEVPETSGDH